MASVTAEQKTANRKKRDQLLTLGQRMSNVFYNMAQASDIPDSWKRISDQCRREWDELRRKP